MALDPDALVAASFPTVRRGYDPDAVRRLLTSVADDVRRLREADAELRSALADARRHEVGELDEERVTELLGEEAAAVLTAARHGAAAMRAKATEEATRTLAQAQDDASAHRAQADQDAARRREEADAEVAAARQAAAEVREEAAADRARAIEAAEAELDAARRTAQELRQEAAAECDRAIEAAKAEGRKLVIDAQAVRERILTDLAQRRQAVRAQIDQLRADRDRIVEAMASVRAGIDAAEEQLRVSLDEARTAAGAQAAGQDSLEIDDLDLDALAARSQADLDDAGVGPALAVAADDEADGDGDDDDGPGGGGGGWGGHDDDDGHDDGGPPTAAMVLDLSAEEEAPGPVGAQARDEPPEHEATATGPPDDASEQPPEAVGDDELGAAAPVAEEPVEVLAVVAADEAEIDEAEVADEGGAAAVEGAEEVADRAAVLDVVDGDDLDAELDDLAHELDADDLDELDDQDDDEDDELEPAEADGELAILVRLEELAAGREQVGREVLRADPAEAPAAEAPVPDPDDDGDPPGEGIDALFARIRASRADAVARAQEVLAAPEVAPDGADGGAGDEADDEGEVPDDRPAWLRERSEAIEPIERAVARRLKRVLADEESAVLDLLRKVATVTVDELIGSSDEQAQRYRVAVEADLWDAALAGQGFMAVRVEEAALIDEGADLVAVPVADVLASVVTGLRDRLAADVAEAGGTAAELPDVVRAAYREWRVGRLDEVAAHATLCAFAAGAHAALVPGTPVRWELDPTAPPCPDGEVDAAAGSVPAGSPFPSGHLHAPAGPGCRCQVVPTDHQ